MNEFLFAFKKARYCNVFYIIPYLRLELPNGPGLFDRGCAIVVGWGYWTCGLGLLRQRSSY